MTATIATTPVELVEKIFTDMGIGPTETQSMAGDFTTRATAEGLRLGTHRSVPPTSYVEEGAPRWETGTSAVIADSGTVLSGMDLEDVWEGTGTATGSARITSEEARTRAAHLRAAADAADRQAAQGSTKSAAEEA
jgi:hypothetical protein